MLSFLVIYKEWGTLHSGTSEIQRNEVGVSLGLCLLPLSPLLCADHMVLVFVALESSPRTAAELNIHELVTERLKLPKMLSFWERDSCFLSTK